VAVRLFQDGEKRLAVLRLFWIPTILSLKFVFEMLLCQKLVEHTRELWYGLIMSPVFILLQLLMIRACRVN
ncbi:Transmembrane protein 203, partial [Charadrius vociferus]